MAALARCAREPTALINPLPEVRLAAAVLASHDPGDHTGDCADRLRTAAYGSIRQVADRRAEARPPARCGTPPDVFPDEKRGRANRGAAPSSPPRATRSCRRSWQQMSHCLARAVRHGGQGQIRQA